jgi:predicted metal-dependent HD superfamily phosphohydrolase
MLSMAETMNPNNPSLLYLAILFHDVVYDTNRKDNEEKSAEFAENWLKNKFVNEEIKEVKRLILATKHQHKNETDKDAQIIVDCDLAGLGQSWEGYKKNGENIRKEYSQFSDEEFKNGRIKFLENMLKQPKIFYILTLLESKARENMKRELEELKNEQ